MTIRQKREERYPLSAICLFCLISMDIGTPVTASEGREKWETINDNWSLGLLTKRLVDSHTSYEFGNPFPPYQTPLSRLEFPLDSWWLGGGLKGSYRRLGLEIKALRSIAGDTPGHMEDSDWDDDVRPDTQTVYSHSENYLEPGYMVDAEIDLDISDLIALPNHIRLAPAVGFRWQHFNFTTHDGAQYDLTENEGAVALPGNGIVFEQTYWQYFIGIRTDITGIQLLGIDNFDLFLKCDWAYVEGNNQDHHLLRAGNRFTYENTDGDAWRIAGGFKKTVSESLVLGLAAEYLTLRTTGSHRLVNNLYDIDFKFYQGVKVWSQQLSLTLSLEYRF